MELIVSLPLMGIVIMGLAALFLKFFGLWFRALLRAHRSGR